ncbi:MAG TPA: GNAT family N-acetyltransferase [Acidimicrobiia bacterium]|nr:GNAT family N-acetyltransferase [Acidimicrobiia bacterium]
MHTPERLVRHLASWLGAWPPPSSGVTVVGSPRRTMPGWDGAVRILAGVSTPEGTIVSVPPAAVAAVTELAETLAESPDALGEALQRPGGRLFAGSFRWSDSPAPDQGRGVWLPREDPRVLPWLHPFNGDVLVGFEDGEVAAGVGRKLHDEWGHELAVVTEPDHRGRGWAADLIAQAAHRVLVDGAIPTYLHSPDNEASARTAEAAGFPDRGWRILGFSAPSTRPAER